MHTLAEKDPAKNGQVVGRVLDDSKPSKITIKVLFYFNLYYNKNDLFFFVYETKT